MTTETPASSIPRCSARQGRPLKQLTSFVKVETFQGEMLVVDPAALKLLAETALGEISHYLRPAISLQLAKILEGSEATGNDKFRLNT